LLFFRIKLQNIVFTDSILLSFLKSLLTLSTNAVLLLNIFDLHLIFFYFSFGFNINLAVFMFLNLFIISYFLMYSLFFALLHILSCNYYFLLIVFLHRNFLVRNCRFPTTILRFSPNLLCNFLSFNLPQLFQLAYKIRRHTSRPCRRARSI